MYDLIECYQKTDDDYKKTLFKAQLKKHYQIKITDRETKKPFDEFKKEVESNEYIKNQCKSIIVCSYLKRFTDDFETFKSKINTFT